MRYDPDDCDRQYNARAAVPEHPAIFARWAKAAAAARAGLSMRAGLAYGGTPRQCVDLYPAARTDAPLLAFIHGGYWRSGAREDFAWIAPPFVERGVSVALIGYDLAPAVTLRTITLQVLRALEWLWRNAPEHGFDSSRIVVGGHSAGGHLAAMSACALWPQWDPDLPTDLVKGVVAVSGLFDLAPLRHASFLSADLNLDEADAFQLSPAWMTPAHGLPVITAVGGLESAGFHAQAALLARQWPRNLRAELPMPGANHMTVLEGLADPGNALFQAALDLLENA